MTPEKIRVHINSLILNRLRAGEAEAAVQKDYPTSGEHRARRNEALREFLSLSLPGMDEGSVATVSNLIPELPEELYRKWIAMFADRLLETIPPAQLNDLCDGSVDNNATLSLVYLMFMESARMEKQIASDLAALAKQPARTDAKNGQLDALSHYLKARLQLKTGN